MATETDRYDPSASYTARVTRVVTVGAFKYLPRDETVFTGEMLNRIVEEFGADAVDYAHKV